MRSSKVHSDWIIDNAKHKCTKIASFKFIHWVWVHSFIRNSTGSWSVFAHELRSVGAWMISFNLSKMAYKFNDRKTSTDKRNTILLHSIIYMSSMFFSRSAIVQGDRSHTNVNSWHLDLGDHFYESNSAWKSNDIESSYGAIISMTFISANDATINLTRAQHFKRLSLWLQVVDVWEKLAYEEANWINLMMDGLSRSPRFGVKPWVGLYRLIYTNIWST